ncbi:MAG: GDP-mannose 4,6-dehydratase, partial [Aeropyrum sp.]|nr:GDP-mannose 4,6-dehydratase [Aeropyrum sp.]
ALRVFNVYGPGMRPGPYAGVVLRFIEALLRGEAPVIYGDGMQTRDFVYVDDVARAHVMALAGRASGIFNVGSGVETRIIDLYRMVCGEIGWCPEPRHEERRPGDVTRSVADISRIRETLGWQPEISLEEGVRRTITYYKSKLAETHT